MTSAAPTADVLNERTAIVHDPARLVALEGVHNFRDLGGYELADGRTIGWGRLFRADGLYRLSDDDLDIIDALGVRTVIDLRSDGEIRKYGTFPVDRFPVAFHSLSIIDTTWNDADLPEVTDDEQGEVDFLTWAYRDMLAAGGDRFAEAIQQLALVGVGPAVFHCAAGKDRTGVLAALILGGLGVDSEVIVADYGLTRAGMDRMRAWVQDNHPEMAERMQETPSFMLAAHPQAMANIIDGLVDDHGSIRSYLATIGVGTALLDSLADTLTV